MLGRGKKTGTGFAPFFTPLTEDEGKKKAKREEQKKKERKLCGSVAGVIVQKFVFRYIDFSFFSFFLPPSLGAAPPIAWAADWDWSSPGLDAFANYAAITAGAAEEGALLSTGFVRGPSVEVRPSPPFIPVGGGPGRRTQTGGSEDGGAVCRNSGVAPSQEWRGRKSPFVFPNRRSRCHCDLPRSLVSLVPTDIQFAFMTSERGEVAAIGNAVENFLFPNYRHKNHNRETKKSLQSVGQ